MFVCVCEREKEREKERERGLVKRFCVVMCALSTSRSVVDQHPELIEKFIVMNAPHTK
jgi:hypothetical protein